MYHIDKAKVNQVVYEMSKDSLFYKNSIRHDVRTLAKLREMHDKLSHQKEWEKKRNLKLADDILIEMEAKRNLSRVHVVCDMDIRTTSTSLSSHNVQQPQRHLLCDVHLWQHRRRGRPASQCGVVRKALVPHTIFTRHQSTNTARQRLDHDRATIH